MFTLFTAGLVFINGEEFCKDKEFTVLDLEDQCRNEFPVNVDLCTIFKMKNNCFTKESLKYVQSRRGDYLDLTNSLPGVENLTCEDLPGWPDLQHLMLNKNSIRYIQDCFLEGRKELRRLDMENNGRVLEYFPFGSARNGLQLYLDGTTTPCDCAMKRAILEGRVKIETGPICLGEPGENYEDVLEKLPPQETTTISHDTNGKVFNGSPTSDCACKLQDLHSA